MRITPKTENEISQSNLLPEGVYHFEVTNASDKVSKSGNDMIELKLRIALQDGSQRVLTDYLLDAMSFKLRHFCVCAGLLEKYNAGQLLAYDCIGKTGMVHIIVQKGKEKPDGGFYPDKNSVRDYQQPDSASGVVANFNNFNFPASDDSSDIPF